MVLEPWPAQGLSTNPRTARRGNPWEVRGELEAETAED